jgi:superfamily II DNA or RNA helicase
LNVIYGAHACKLETKPSEAETEQLRFLTVYEPEAAKQAAARMRYGGGRGRFGPKIESRRWLYHKGSRTFPTGLLDECLGALHNPTVVGRPVLAPAQPWKLIPPVDVPNWQPRRAQLEAWEALTQAGRGVATLCTGAGKSILCAMLASSYPGERVLVSTPNLRLLNQNRDEIEAYLGEPVGILGDTERVLEPRVVVATIQSLQSRLDAEDQEVQAWLGTVDVWVCDESHGAACESYQVLSRALEVAHRRFGITATWRREDGTQRVLEAVLSSKVLYQYTYEAGVKDGIVVPIHVWLRTHPHHNTKLKKRVPYLQTYNDRIVHNWARNVQIVLDVAELLDLGLDPCLVMVRAKDHGKWLAKMLQCPYIDGDDSSKKVGKKGEKVSKVEQALTDFLYNKTSRVLVATNILNVGVNLKPLKSAVNAAAGDSGIDAEQKPGRGGRLWPGKTAFHYRDYLDIEPNHFGDHARKREYLYKKTFPSRVKSAKLLGAAFENGASFGGDNPRELEDR